MMMSCGFCGRLLKLMATHPLVKTNPIRQRRLAHGWTQVELARLAGLWPSKLSQLEHGLLPTQTDLVKLARALGCGVHELDLAGQWHEHPEESLQEEGG